MSTEKDNSGMSEGTGLSRRNFLKFVGGSLATAGALSTGFPAFAQQGKLKLAMYGYMTKGIPIYQVIARHKERHPNLVVTMDEIPGGPQDWQSFFQKRRLEARKKTASHDLYIGLTPFINVASLARAGLFSPLTEELPEEVIDDLFDSTQDEGTFMGDNELYALPWWTDVFGFITRKSMLEEAVGNTESPKTWNEVMENAKKIEDHYDQISGFGADWAFSHRLAIPLLGTITEEPFVEMEGFNGILNVESDAFTKTLEMIKELHQYMPSNAGANLGSSKAFQSDALAQEFYWQTQYLRAMQAGVPAEDIQLAEPPKVNYANSVFWSAAACIPTYGENKQAAIDFIVEAMIDDPKTQEWTYDNWKIMPFDSVTENMEERDALPSWAPSLINALKSATAIPMNGVWLGVEQPAYKNQVERMLLEGQSIDTTQENIATEFHKELKKMG